MMDDGDGGLKNSEEAVKVGDNCSEYVEECRDYIAKHRSSMDSEDGV
jgi:hypothetical protein